MVDEDEVDEDEPTSIPFFIDNSNWFLSSSSMIYLFNDHVVHPSTIKLQQQQQQNWNNELVEIEGVLSKIIIDLES